MGVIYKITSPSNKAYVGKTYDLNKRIASHKHCAKSGKNLLLSNSIRKYGWEAHRLEVIEEMDDNILNEREIFWITDKRPILLLTEMYEVICEYDSAKEASDFWKIPKTTINRAAMYNWLKPIRTGHIFIYKDLWEEILESEKAA